MWLLTSEVATCCCGQKLVLFSSQSDLMMMMMMMLTSPPGHHEQVHVAFDPLPGAGLRGRKVWSQSQSISSGCVWGGHPTTFWQSPQSIHEAASSRTITISYFLVPLKRLSECSRLDPWPRNICSHPFSVSERSFNSEKWLLRWITSKRYIVTENKVLYSSYVVEVLNPDFCAVLQGSTKSTKSVESRRRPSR